MNRSFYIGNTEFRLESPGMIVFDRVINEFLQPVMEIKRTVVYHVRYTEAPQPINMRYLAQIDYPPHIVGGTETGECRIYQDMFTGEPSVLYREMSDNEVALTFLGSCPEEWHVSLNDLNYLAIERQMIQSDGMILHSSFIVTDGEAVLFTAPSGTGKSTQAALWERCGGARIMNGDRTLLIRRGGEWYAAGFPFSGSSGISHNGIFRIRALVMIYQDRVNGGSRISCSSAFKRSYPEIVRNYWNMDFEDKVIILLNDFLSGVLRITYGCNMEEDAVRCLEVLMDSKENENENNQK